MMPAKPDIPKRKIAGYGWRRQAPDWRDGAFAFRASRADVAALPDRASLASHNPAVRDQGPLGSCTGFGTTGARMNMLRQSHKRTNLSPLFVYQNELIAENAWGVDGGAEIRDGMKVFAKLGCCEEKDWPYDPARFKTKPSGAVYADAARRTVPVYRPVYGMNALMLAIVRGHPVVFGFSVYEPFESDEVARTGIVPMPQQGDRYLGGHCVFADEYSKVGRDPAKWWVGCQNSWSRAWGMKGRFRLPWAYVENADLAADFSIFGDF